MKKIEKWLFDNNYNFIYKKYGNPYYFNDGFLIDKIYMSGLEHADIQKLYKHFKRNKNIVIDSEYNFACGWTFTICTKSDYIALSEHCKRVAQAQEHFTNWYHYFRTTYKDSCIYC